MTTFTLHEGEGGGGLPQFHFGDRLRKARESRGFTASAFADRLGISRDSLRKYEHGGRVPKPVAIAWAAETGYTLDDLFGSDLGGPASACFASDAEQLALPLNVAA